MPRLSNLFVILNTLVEKLTITPLPGRITSWSIAFLRLYVGLYYIRTGWNKAAQNWGFEFGASEFGVENFIRNNLEFSYGFYRPFLEKVVIPNAEVFGFLVAWGELLAGAAVLAGLFVRPAATGIIFMNLNFAFAKGRHFWLPSSDWLLIYICLAFIAVNAGKFLGGDALIGGGRNGNKT